MQWLEIVLEYARSRSRRYTGLSNEAWWISAVASAGGTLLAVSHLRDALTWDHVVHELEDARVDALIELRLAEEALERVLASAP